MSPMPTPLGHQPVGQSHKARRRGTTAFGLILRRGCRRFAAARHLVDHRCALLGGHAFLDEIQNDADRFARRVGFKARGPR